MIARLAFPTTLVQLAWNYYDLCFLKKKGRERKAWFRWSLVGSMLLFLGSVIYRKKGSRLAPDS